MRNARNKMLLLGSKKAKTLRVWELYRFNVAHTDVVQSMVSQTHPPSPAFILKGCHNNVISEDFYCLFTSSPCLSSLLFSSPSVSWQLFSHPCSTFFFVPPHLPSHCLLLCYIVTKDNVLIHARFGKMFVTLQSADRQSCHTTGHLWGRHRWGRKLRLCRESWWTNVDDVIKREREQ